MDIIQQKNILCNSSKIGNCNVLNEIVYSNTFWKWRASAKDSMFACTTMRALNGLAQMSSNDACIIYSYYVGLECMFPYRLG